MTAAHLHFGVFEVYGPQVGGTVSWPHPLSDCGDFLDVNRWIRLAELMDGAGFDFLFFADGFGYPIIDGDVSTQAVEHGINFSGLDPATLIPILASRTRELGFVVTASTGIDHPLPLARRFATLDHLTGGRIGWNIVTGASQNAVAELFGHPELIAHDTRYAMAAEYVSLAVQYWETGWSDDALVRDAESGLYARRDGIHRVQKSGEHYSTSGYFSAPPSPQRTPTLFQAGTSPAGRAFAADHAECVFIQATTPAHTARNSAAIRAAAAERGRDAASVRIMAGVTVFVAESAAQAQQLADEFDALQTDEIVAALYAGNTGIDLLALDPDQSLEQIANAAGAVGQLGVSNIERFLPTDGSPAPTVRDILDSLRGRGTRGFRIVGDPEQVADRLEALAAEAGLDGFLLEPVFGTADVEAFARLVLPVLRERGRIADPDGSTLRERMSERVGARIDPTLPVRSALAD